jgi:hypothetical protein
MKRETSINKQFVFSLSLSLLYHTSKREVVGSAKPNKNHENLGGATKPVQKSFGWQLILAHP